MGFEGPWEFAGQRLLYPGGGSAEGLFDGVSYGDTSFFEDKLRRNEPFTFLRLGDVDWDYILGGRLIGGKDSTQPLSSALQHDLQRLLLEPKEGVMIGTARIMAEKEKWRVVCEAWLREHGIKIRWWDCSPMDDAARAGRFQPIVDALNTRRLVMVGPDHMRLINFLRIARFIETPLTNAYGEKDRLLGEIRDDAVMRPDSVYLLSAAMTARVLGYEAHGLGTIIDCGSLWHPYIGRLTRKWHRIYDFERLVEV